MKLQAIMNRTNDKEGTDLIDIIRVVQDPECGPIALSQITSCPGAVAQDIGEHVEYWLSRRRDKALEFIERLGIVNVGKDDIDLVHDLLMDAC